MEALVGLFVGFVVGSHAISGMGKSYRGSLRRPDRNGDVRPDPQFLEQLRDGGYSGRVERAILFSIEAWDVNCPQHIHKRFPQSAVAPVIEKLQAQVQELQQTIAEYERRAGSDVVLT